MQCQSANSEIAIKATLKLIKVLPGFKWTKSVCCMEHTGIYNAHLLTHLHKIKLPIWLESSLQIKKAGGLQRGKTDAIDAVRIAQYARAGGPVPLPRSDTALATSAPHFTKTGGT
ncbi:hypothetical protein GCM10027299_02950 [Larkinella ripae]